MFSFLLSLLLVFVLMELIMELLNGLQFLFLCEEFRLALVAFENSLLICKRVGVWAINHKKNVKFSHVEWTSIASMFLTNKNGSIFHFCLDIQVLIGGSVMTMGRFFAAVSNSKPLSVTCIFSPKTTDSLTFGQRASFRMF